MKIRNVIMAGVIAAGLAISGSVQASHEKEETEQKLSKSDVPAAVQKTAEAEAKGGKIVRWEKEGDNYEAVIEKRGKQTGVEMTADGKVVSRHDEAKEHKEKGEKY
jgi:hypothetical protein